MSKNIGEKNFLSISTFPLLGGKEEYFYYKTISEQIDGFLPEDVIHQTEHKFKNHPYNSKELIENNIYSKSQFVNDYVVNPHPRFGCLERNTRIRRGRNIEALAPIYNDEKTNFDKTDDEPFPGFIYMDCQTFGAGNSCFQVTLGSESFESALYMYDQLIPLTPLLVKILLFIFMKFIFIFIF